MDNSVSESLLKAMATMFSDAPQTVIECNVVSCDDPILGSYTVEYQMNKFTAFASANLETPFSAGSGVYVIVPNGDFTKTKYILGAAAPGKAAAAISDNIYDVDTFVNISDNMLNPSSIYALQSYKTTQAEGSREEININLATALTSSTVEHFLNDGKRIFHLDFAVKTDLPAEQRNKEDAKYGIIVTFNGENNTVKSWELSTIDMEGSPMAYDVWTKGRLKFEIPEDFVFDSSQNIGIKIYKQDFNVKEDPVNDDILFRNVELYAVRYFSESEMGGYYLNINAEASPYFIGTGASKKLTATLRANGQRVNSSNIDYYWFEEDLSVNSNSEYYVQNAGLGWKCVNAENSEGQVHNYIPADSYTVLKTKVKGSKQYKCLTVYNNNLVSNTITIVNDDPSAFSFVIDSDAGPAFPQDKGTIKLTARFFYNGVSTVAANINNIDFNWAFFDSDGKWDSNFPHSTPSAKRQVGDYIEQDILIDSNNIVQMLTAKVNAVVTTAFGDFIVGNQLGTTRLNLVIKADDAEVSLYNLIMTDSEKVYKYSSSGYSPMVTQYEGAVASRVDAIKPISYRIYHQDGTEFSQSEYNACITTWRVPVNSLIDLDNPPSPQDGYYVITSSGKADLNYNIADFYESSKSDDTIYLSIDFNGYEIKGVAHIQTIKNGELGTNGTSCICTLKARVGGQDEPSFAYQEKDADGNIHSLKLIAFNNAWYANKADGKFYDRTGIELKLIPYVQRGNDKLTDDSAYTASYSMCSNGLTNIVNVNSSTGILTLGDISSVSEANLKNNIVKAVVTVDGWGIPTFYPIEIIRINTNAPGVSFYEDDIPLLLGGFNSVQYRSSGYEPLMQPDNNIFEYDDSYLAAAPTWSTESRFDTKSNGDQCTVTPKEKRESANLYYYVSASGSLNASPTGITGTITHYKPIIVYNDNYGNETVNGWDGVSLAIDDNNATIMGVMSGWGEKDDQNKFSGVLLGSVKQGNNVQRGILAYNKSDQTFSLDADDGSLHIGRSGKGRIDIIPANDTDPDSAKIVGGDYRDAQGTGTGMEIDLVAPSIKWGNRKFRVEPNGKLYATDGEFTGKITATDGEIQGDLNVTGSFIMSDNPDDPEEYYVTIEQGEIVLYTICNENDNGAEYNAKHDFYWNKRTQLNKRGFHVDNNFFNETLDASTSNNTTEPAYVGMAGVFDENWNQCYDYIPNPKYSLQTKSTPTSIEMNNLHWNSGGSNWTKFRSNVTSVASNSSSTKYNLLFVESHNINYSSTDNFGHLLVVSTTPLTAINGYYQSGGEDWWDSQISFDTSSYTYDSEHEYYFYSGTFQDYFTDGPNFNATGNAIIIKNYQHESYPGDSEYYEGLFELVYLALNSNFYPEGYHRGMVDINSDGIKLSHFLSDGEKFDSNRIYDLRVGHFTKTDDVIRYIDEINQYWDDGVAPKVPEETVLLMQDPDPSSDKFMMMANDQMIMVGSSYTSKQSPSLFRVRNKQEPDKVNTVMRDHLIGIYDYFNKKSPYQINGKPMYRLTNKPNSVTPGDQGTDLEDGCFIVVYEGPDRTDETITITIKAALGDTIYIKDNAGTLLDTIQLDQSTSIITYASTTIEKYKSYTFISKLNAVENNVEIISSSLTVDLSVDSLPWELYMQFITDGNDTAHTSCMFVLSDVFSLKTYDLTTQTPYFETDLLQVPQGSGSYQLRSKEALSRYLQYYNNWQGAVEANTALVGSYQNTWWNKTIAFGADYKGSSNIADYEEILYDFFTIYNGGSSYTRMQHILQKFRILPLWKGTVYPRNNTYSTSMAEFSQGSVTLRFYTIFPFNGIVKILTIDHTGYSWHTYDPSSIIDVSFTKPFVALIKAVEDAYEVYACSFMEYNSDRRCIYRGVNQVPSFGASTGVTWENKCVGNYISCVDNYDTHVITVTVLRDIGDLILATYDTALYVDGTVHLGSYKAGSVITIDPNTYPINGGRCIVALKEANTVVPDEILIAMKSERNYRGKTFVFSNATKSFLKSPSYATYINSGGSGTVSDFCGTVVTDIIGGEKVVTVAQEESVSMSGWGPFIGYVINDPHAWDNIAAGSYTYTSGSSSGVTRDIGMDLAYPPTPYGIVEVVISGGYDDPTYGVTGDEVHTIYFVDDLTMDGKKYYATKDGERTGEEYTWHTITATSGNQYCYASVDSTRYAAVEVLGSFTWTKASSDIHTLTDPTLPTPTQFSDIVLAAIDYLENL